LLFPSRLFSSVFTYRGWECMGNPPLSRNFGGPRPSGPPEGVVRILLRLVPGGRVTLCDFFAFFPPKGCSLQTPGQARWRRLVLLTRTRSPPATSNFPTGSIFSWTPSFTCPRVPSSLAVPPVRRPLRILWRLSFGPLRTPHPHRSCTFGFSLAMGAELVLTP